MPSASDHLVLLPHTWLFVPCDVDLRIVAYQEARTPCGVTYTATVSVDDEDAGVIHNDGWGGATRFLTHPHARFGTSQMADYAAACRTHNGGVLADEWLLEELVNSWALTDAIGVARRSGNRLLRELDAVEPNSTTLVQRPDDLVGPVILSANCELVTPFTQAERQAVIDQLAEMPESGFDRWWQIWVDVPGTPGGVWEDLTPRPRGVPPTDPAAGSTR